MIRISRLYSEPETFDPIRFESGINLILGETNETSEKTNGVGKSLSVEFINFCLLKQFNQSRLSKIPETAFSHETLICLDIHINNKEITIKRSIKNQSCPLLIIGNKPVLFSNVSDANQYLTNLLFGSSSTNAHPSFRGILGPLIRDERSEFKSIIKCYDTSLRIPVDYTPHLYLLSIDPSFYIEAKKLQQEIDNTTKAKREIKKDIEKLTGKSFKEANSELNELNSQVEKIKSEMDTLENTQSFEILKNEVVKIETEIDTLRTQAGIFKNELAKVKIFEGDNYIDADEVAALYERFKDGLGDMIKREIDEVTEFKKKIDNFQRTLVDSRVTTLKEKIADCNKKIKNLDKIYKEKLSIIDKGGALKNLKITISAYETKLSEQARLSVFINKHEEYDSVIKITKQKRSGKITLLDSLVNEASYIKESFEKIILKIHNYIMGNNRCSFNIEINDKKEIVNYELRIYDDGSHSNEREKVFIYDVALLLNKEVSKAHPKLLIHDNIFNVDQDTLIKSLDYIYENESFLSDKQYILTLNSDRLHTEEINNLKMDIDLYKRASFTKKNRFLKTHYQET